MRRLLYSFLLLAFVATAALAQDVSNSLIIRPAPSGSDPTLSCTGSDTNCGVKIVPKGSGQVSLGGGPLVIVPTGTSVQALGNDLIIGTSPASIAPAGPGQGAVVIRVRLGSTPGTCKLVVAAGTTYNQEVTLLDKIPGGLGC